MRRAGLYGSPAPSEAYIFDFDVGCMFNIICNYLKNISKVQEKLFRED